MHAPLATRQQPLRLARHPFCCRYRYPFVHALCAATCVKAQQSVATCSRQHTCSLDLSLLPPICIVHRKPTQSPANASITRSPPRMRTQPSPSSSSPSRSPSPPLLSLLPMLLVDELRRGSSAAKPPQARSTRRRCAGVMPGAHRTWYTGCWP